MPAISIDAEGDRFARLRAIEWWNQTVVDNARILVIGAGALGNEVIKNLALLGVANVTVVDMDKVELSNLSRSVLFREADEGKPKAECAARAAKEIYPNINILPVVGNVLADVGLGHFRWADAVIGALDNREARVFVNSSCALTGRPWFDGGIEVLQGIARGFSAPENACYECTMSQTDWDLLNKRRSCSLLARRALASSGVPTTPITASVIAAVQCAEVLKLLHGLPGLIGKAFIFEGAAHSSFTASYQINPDCPWHEKQPEIVAAAELNSDSPLEAVRAMAEQKLGRCDTIEFAREIVERVECPSCRGGREVFQAAEKIDAGTLLCPGCGKESAPVFMHSVPRGSPLLQKSPRELGLPLWDVVWARCGAKSMGCEFSGDKPSTNRLANGN